MAYTLTVLEKRFRAHGIFFAEYWNIKTTNTAAANTKGMKALQAAMGDKYARVHFTEGTYQFAEPILRKGDFMTFVGVGSIGWHNNITTFMFPPGSDGMQSNCNCLILDNIRLRGNGGDKNNPLPGNGLFITGISSTKDVGVSGFSGGFGMYIKADLQVGTNSSGSRHDNAWIATNRAGIKVEGMDANSINFFGGDVRDHLGIGFEDDSLLGTNLFGTMFHANWEKHIKITSVNSPAGLFGVYEENEANPSEYSALTSRIAGYSYGTTGGYVQKGIYANRLELENIGVDAMIRLKNRYGGDWNLQKIKQGDREVWQFDVSNIHSTKIYLLRGEDVYKGKPNGAIGFGYEWPNQFKSIY